MAAQMAEMMAAHWVFLMVVKMVALSAEKSADWLGFSTAGSLAVSLVVAKAVQTADPMVDSSAGLMAFPSAAHLVGTKVDPSAVYWVER